MKRLLILWILLAITANGQVTINVTSIPPNTPADDTLYIAGDFQGWDPGSTPLTFNDNGYYTITIPEGTGTVEYKFTRGNWDAVEGNEEGGYLPNREFTFTGSPQTFEVTILSWEDLDGGSQSSTATENVYILDEAFYMPQLDRTRKIWIYLPPDYEASAKNYPVLYMQDGQNLFDDLTAFAGEWQVDETLNQLFDEGDYGAIVVGIENGGGLRIDEYTPWNTSSGGGEGDSYMEFIAETLKPYIDENYRTRSEPEYNALIGSSLGALISTYGGIKYADKFQKIGSMSPAYWIVLDQLNDYINSHAGEFSSMRIYHVAGINESSTMVDDVESVVNHLLNNGLETDNSFVKWDGYGQHNEMYWRGEFGALYQWLFEDENLSVNDIIDESDMKILAKNNKIYVLGLLTKL